MRFHGHASMPFIWSYNNGDGVVQLISTFGMFGIQNWLHFIILELIPFAL